jgi:hypothetical protein
MPVDQPEAQSHAVAVDYYQLRTQDALKQLLDSTVVAYQESLRLTQALYETGIVAERSIHCDAGICRYGGEVLRPNLTDKGARLQKAGEGCRDILIRSVDLLFEPI